MKKAFSLILFCLIALSANAQTPADTVYEAKDVEVIPTLITNIPGVVKSSAVYDNCRPLTDSTAVEILEFIVEKDGSTSNIEVEKSISPCYDSECIKILAKLKFTPGKQEGLPVRVRMRMPMTFMRR